MGLGGRVRDEGGGFLGEVEEERGERGGRKRERERFSGRRFEEVVNSGQGTPSPL